MALLQPRRLIADESLLGALRFAKNLLTHRDARRRADDAQHLPQPLRTVDGRGDRRS